MELFITPYRLCPVCKSVKLIRPIVRTCGAPECIWLWRRLKLDLRIKAEEDAAKLATEQFKEKLSKLFN